MTTQTPTVTQTSQMGGIVRAARPYITGWRGLLLLAAIALIVGAALNWSWLVAAGIAPLLLTALPCVAMCALGLCANRMMGKSCSTEAAPDKPAHLSSAQPSLKAEAQLPRLADLQSRH
jgi:hypothetical protein